MTPVESSVSPATDMTSYDDLRAIHYSSVSQILSARFRFHVGNENARYRYCFSSGLILFNVACDSDRPG